MMQEEKAKAYDEALENARQEYNTTENVERKQWLEELFPELKESEDDKIRKALIRFHKSTIDIDGIKGENILTWLEKQGEKNTAKPKFHEGDWIVHNVANFVFQIVGVGTYGYNVVNREGYAKTISLSNEENYHLWTIQDAKPGDVLFHSDSASNGIFIFKELLNCVFNVMVVCYCDYDSEDHFCLGENHTCCWTDAKILHPATKEQRDTLMKAMTDAGWGFDFEKKEMKKIGQKHIEWSAEDERSIRDSIFYLKSAKKYFEKDDDIVWDEKWFSLCIKWLESLHKRLQPQNTWKPSDEQIVALEHFIRSIGESGYVSPYDNNTKLLYSLLNDLKKLNG